MTLLLTSLSLDVTDTAENFFGDFNILALIELIGVGLFLWALFLQRKELRLQREELIAQREQLKNQTEEFKKTAKANRQSAEALNESNQLAKLNLRLKRAEMIAKYIEIDPTEYGVERANYHAKLFNQLAEELSKMDSIIDELIS